MTGHWLMLYHTFQNGCSWPGDWIDDTPQQKFTDFADSCPSNPLDFSDSCPLSPGLDPMGKWLDFKTMLQDSHPSWSRVSGSQTTL